MICPACETTIPDHTDICPRCGWVIAGSPVSLEDTTLSVADERPTLPDLPTAAPSSLATPGEPGRYVILRKLGSGGMGVVYKVYDHKMERFVAVKRLNPQKEKQGGIMRFFNEAKAIARLNHPNIVSIYDIVEDRRGFFIVMELVKGVSVRMWVKRHGPIPVRRGVAIMRQVAEALCYAHKRDIAHRDVKPGNILIGRGFVPKLVDFGVAVIGDPKSEGSGRIAGTRGYMAPEVRWNRGVADARADVYSFGMTLLHVFSGEKPWRVQRYPSRFADIILKATRENPKDRFPSMEAVLEEVRRIEEDATFEPDRVPDDVARALSPPVEKRDVVEILSGDRQGETISLTDNLVLAGRSHERCQILLDDPETSRVHLKIVREDGEVYAFDMGSHNGTFVGGKPVKAVRVREGSEIRIGNTLLRFL